MTTPFNRCEIIPLPDQQISYRIDGVERLRWHFGPNYPRPFFFPLIGPSGAALTRMGHPGAPDHDHHRSIWFAHAKVSGIDFWSDRSPGRIRQKSWLAYQDGEECCQSAVELEWLDGHDPKPLLEQQLITEVRPGPGNETFVEIQTSFRPTAATLEFQKTNFGFLAVRVAKHLSTRFGAGVLSNSEGATGEPALFAKPAKWVDYTGPVRSGGKEGILFFDHPSNPGHPTSWHVRHDGWMGAAVCLREAIVTSREQPLRLRYLLHAHRGGAADARADEVARSFAESQPFEAVRVKIPHVQYQIRRIL